MILKIRAITILSLTVVGRILVRNGNRQRDLVVNDDHVAGSICNDGHASACRIKSRECYRLIISVQLFCICRICRCRNGCPDRHIASLFIRDTDRGTIKIMINGISRFVQFEVGIVSMRLIYPIAVLAGNILRGTAEMRSIVIHGPVIDDISARAATCRRTGSCSARSQYSLTCRIDRNAFKVCAVRMHRIVDGNCALLPDREQILDWIFLISSDLRCNYPVCTGRFVLGAVPYQEVCRCAALGFCPALEGIAFTGRRSENVHCLVDL